MLRAGPFSDERVIRLANRRFTPFYFDLANHGVAGDPDAREFVVAQRSELGGRSVGTPPVLFMTAAGKVVDEISNYATAEQVLQKMLTVLKAHPELAKPSAAEAELESLIERAELAIDLCDYAGARKILASESGARAQYILGRLARFRRDWKAMKKHFDRVDDPKLESHVRMERAYRYWYERKFDKLAAALEGFKKGEPRYTEARYYFGLANFHLQAPKKAIEVWSKTVKSCSQDPWIYRADWAYCNAKSQGERQSFSTVGRRSSLLNRIGYMGNRNPDLAGPPKRKKTSL